MINLIKILLQFSSFKINNMEIHLSFITLENISENSVQFLQLYDTFTQKHHKYRQILCYLCKINIL